MNLSHQERIQLHEFNNLTKSLSFNMYDVCYTKTREEREAYIEYIDEQYNAERLTGILTHVSDIIGAHVLNVSKQDYVPQGQASPSLYLKDRSSRSPLNILMNLPVLSRQAPPCIWTRAILLSTHILNIIHMKESVPSVRTLMCPPAEKYLP